MIEAPSVKVPGLIGVRNRARRRDRLADELGLVQAASFVRRTACKRKIQDAAKFRSSSYLLTRLKLGCCHPLLHDALFISVFENLRGKQDASQYCGMPEPVIGPSGLTHDF